MTILSDGEIIARCTPPKFVIYGQRFEMGEQHLPVLKPFNDFSTDDEETVKSYVLAHNNASTMFTVSTDPYEKRIAYRPIKAEELRAWKSMIEPFVPGQIRYSNIKRELTAEELDLVRRSHHLMPSYDPNLVLPDYIRCDNLDEGFMAREKIISKGLSSAGYDVSLDTKFKIFTNINNTVLDPLNFDPKSCVDFEGDICIIPPHSYVLGLTNEYFHIPKNILAICVGKSTYARIGCLINVTPIEPGFEGKVVIEISNCTSLPMKVYANQGIAQFLFLESKYDCSVSYADRGGKYQGQNGLQTALG